MKDAMTDHKAEWVERMLGACVPGGSYCDPQRVADAIREYCAVRAAAPAASEGEDGAVAWQYQQHGQWFTAASDEPWRSKGLPVRPLFAARPAAQVAAPSAARDAERLDWLERQATEGLLWIARQSSTGRGYRLHQTTGKDGYATARAAIDAAIAEAQVAAAPKHDEGRIAVCSNMGDSEANFIADGERLNCPACGGSGHIDDALATQPAAVTDECGRPMTYWGGKSATQPAARRVADVESVVGHLPAPITNPEAWPPNYADGWNACAQTALAGVRESFAQPAEGVSGG